ncbi:MAG: YicC family protein [Lachnospiraceae bacterium]|nr:YicC family protein [Lachnospiraceae bacterium]
MARSMTGFGRGEFEDESHKIVVEMKSVNHRFLDLNIKLPRKLNAFEGDVRNYLKSRLNRGKVDVYINLEESAETSTSVKYNSEIAKMYLDNLNQMSQETGLDFDIKTSHLSRYPEVLELEEVPENEDDLLEILKKALEIATDQFIANRESEGERLKVDLISKVEEMDSYVDILERRSPEIVEEYSAKLREKVAFLLEDNKIDESRIASEIVIYADKVCIDEEMVRLRSHVNETKKVLEEDEETGRKLDFIAQEMNRESNTILSKSTDIEIANIGISLKTLIEKIREQIQNLE